LTTKESKKEVEKGRYIVQKQIQNVLLNFKRINNKNNIKSSNVSGILVYIYPSKSAWEDVMVDLESTIFYLMLCNAIQYQTNQ